MKKYLFAIALLSTLSSEAFSCCVFYDSFAELPLNDFWSLSSDEVTYSQVPDPEPEPSGLHAHCLKLWTAGNEMYHTYNDIVKGTISFDMYVYGTGGRICFDNTQYQNVGATSYFDFHPTHGNLFGVDIPGYAYTPTSMDFDRQSPSEWDMPNPEDYTPIRWDPVGWYNLKAVFDTGLTAFYIDNNLLYSVSVGAGIDTISFTYATRHPMYLDNFCSKVSPIPETSTFVFLGSGLLAMIRFLKNDHRNRS